MANQPSPDKQAVTYRLHRDLVERVKEAAEQQDVTVTAFVTRALETEIKRSARSSVEQVTQVAERHE